jgi:hypothetical protein
VVAGGAGNHCMVFGFEQKFAFEDSSSPMIAGLEAHH